MSRICVVCGKKPQFGNHVSHSDKKTRRLFKPNLQRIRILLDGQPTRANVCTSCIRANNVKRVG